MSVLSVRDLSGSYDGREVLHEVSIALSAGESVALLGPNGSGKSTLLRALTKTLREYRGQISILGTPIDSMTHLEVAKQVALVPQEEVPAFPFTVRDMVTMGRFPVSKGLRDTTEDRSAAERAMATADCLDLADRPVTELSGGERQRVLIARALAQDGPILLLDEPTAHLDISHQIAIARLIRSLAEAGKAILAAVHDLNLAAEFADRAVLLSHGRCVVDAPLPKLLRDPALDEAYGVSFERVELASGRLALFGRDATCP